MKYGRRAILTVRAAALVYVGSSLTLVVLAKGSRKVPGKAAALPGSPAAGESPPR